MAQVEAIIRFAGEMEAPTSVEAEARPGPPDASSAAAGAPDEPAPSLDRAVVLGNAPDHRGGHVRLPALHVPEAP